MIVEQLPDALQQSSEQFEHEAKMAMAVLYMNSSVFPVVQLPNLWALNG